MVPWASTRDDVGQKSSAHRAHEGKDTKIKCVEEPASFTCYLDKFYRKVMKTEWKKGLKNIVKNMFLVSNKAWFKIILKDCMALQLD